MTDVVPTSSGQVEGKAQRGVVRFAGVPFAAPPTGVHRFAPPRPPERWPGIRPAVEAGPTSLQNEAPMEVALGFPAQPMSEDCLSLTIDTPAADSGSRPVLVWIHGGSFVIGSGSSPAWDGARLARRGDVVVVSVNYRLGAAGFLYLGALDPDLGSSGLNGILDQVAALEWVRDNISAFGGDPGNVTVIGGSAGAMSVGCLLVMPAARGLFRRAILMSGAGHATIDVTAAAERTMQYCELAGCGTVSDLRSLPPGRLLDAQAALVEERQGPQWSRSFQPVVDGRHLAARPIDLARGGDLAPVDLLCGTTEEEWRLFAWLEREPTSDVDVAESFAALLPDPAASVALYRRRRGADASPRSILDAMLTDLHFRVPMHQLADASAAAGNQTFLYRFSYRTPIADGMLGACHALDVPFVFDNRDVMTRFVGEHSPDALADAMQRAWVAFARHGDPNGGDLPAWEPQTTGRRPVIRFDEQITMLEDPEPDELAVWDGVV